jgi:hypothetical protein
MDEPTLAAASGLDRYIMVLSQLRKGGFIFEPIDDLFPANIELVQPYSISQEDHFVIFNQD